MRKRRGPERYVSLPLYVRAWRRVRHFPKFVGQLAYRFGWWACHGFPVDPDWHPTRLSMAGFYLTICRSEYHSRIGNYWLLQELIDEYEAESP